MRVCLYEINFWINRLNTADCPPQTDGLHPTNWRLEQNKRMRKKGFVLFVWLSFTWDTGLLSDSEWDWNLHHQLSWFSGLWTQTGSILFSLLNFQPNIYRSWISDSIIKWSYKPILVRLNQSILLSIYLSIYIYTHTHTHIYVFQNNGISFRED